MPALPGGIRNYVMGKTPRARVTGRIATRAQGRAFDASIDASRAAGVPVGRATSLANDAGMAARAPAIAQFDRRAKYGAGAAVALSAGAFQKGPNESRTSYRGPGRSPAGLRNGRDRKSVV